MAPITKRERKLAWLDTETTGLDTSGSILEVGLIVTDENLEELGAYSSVIHVPDKDLRWQMNQWCWTNHKKSGLLDEVQASTKTLAEVEERLCQIFRSQFREPAILAGSSIHFDRNWIKAKMPNLEKLLTHQMVDVTSLMLAHRVVYGYEPEKGKVGHRVISDIRGSIGWLKDYLRFAPFDMQAALAKEQK